MKPKIFLRPFLSWSTIFARDPKRIVWAYDDLQRLSETTMPSLGELFGVDEHGEPIVSLTNDEGAQQDIVLKVCYRNPPWTLAMAHALGLGIYRKPGGPVQQFDDPALWNEIGYRPRHGALTVGTMVTLERSPDSYPPFFPALLSREMLLLTYALPM